MRAAVLAVGVLLVPLMGWAQDYPAVFPTLAGGTMGIAELAQGRWAVGFVIVPRCPACEQVIGWFGRAAEAFPEIRFLLVAPEATPELEALVPDESQVLLDRGGILGGSLGVKRAPTVFLFVEGVRVTRLDWPFTEGALLRALAESLLVEIKPRNPRDLLGEPAPDFVALNLSGDGVALADLSRPLLLVFFDPGCPPCWEALPALAELAGEVAVAVVAFAGEAGLSPAHRERLEEFLAGLEARPLTVLLVLDFEVLSAYRVATAPTYILLDGKGVIRWVQEGALQVEEARKALVEVQRD